MDEQETLRQEIEALKEEVRRLTDIMPPAPQTPAEDAEDIPDVAEDWEVPTEWDEDTPTADTTPQKWYNAAEITTGAASGDYEGERVVKVSRVAAFSGALLLTGSDAELPLVEGVTVYLHVVLTVGTGGTLTGTVTVTNTASGTTPYTGDDYYIPIWHVAGGKLYDATIPGMTKRI